MRTNRCTTDKLSSSWRRHGRDNGVREVNLESGFHSPLSICICTCSAPTTYTWGGHWGLLETANQRKNNPKPQKTIAQNRKPHTKPSKTNTLVISGAYKANYTNNNFIKVYVNVMDLSEAFVSSSIFQLLQASVFPCRFQSKHIFLSKILAALSPPILPDTWALLHWTLKLIKHCLISMFCFNTYINCL